MTKILSPLSREVLADAQDIRGVHVHRERVMCPEDSEGSRALSFVAHEKDVDVTVRISGELERNATYSLDIATFLLDSHAKSDVRVFFVLNEGARLTVRALTHAVGSSSVVHEEIRALAVGEYAHASLLPELALLNDDIRATHGASVVRVRAEHLAYLASRGVVREDAVRLLANAFLEQYGDLS